MSPLPQHHHTHPDSAGFRRDLKIELTSVSLTSQKLQELDRVNDSLISEMMNSLESD